MAAAEGPAGQAAGAGRGADHLDDPGTRAVIAHALLTTMTAVSSSLALLKSDWPRLSEGDRSTLLEMADAQARLMTDLLTDMVRGLPTEVVGALSDLESERSSFGRQGRG